LSFGSVHRFQRRCRDSSSIITATDTRLKGCEGVELGSVEQAGAHALAAAPQMFNDLLPGERRECALSVRDESQGWRLKIDLSLCLEKRDPASDALDTGALGELTEYSS
jgi:hypothetical protein